MTTSAQKIPTGYKQTDVGVIPADWNVVSYDEAFKFLRTAQYSRDQLGKGQTSYVHYGDIHTKWNHFVDLEQGLPTIEDEKINNYSLIEDGDLIVADASEDYEGIGKSVEVKNVKTRQAISGLHTFLLRDKGNYFVKGFRGYIHANPLVKSSMDRLATGLKVYGVSKSNLKLIQIPQPPLPEQATIATALSDVANLISGLDSLIEKKKNIKQGAVQALLTSKRRLPGFVGKWSQMRLCQIVDHSSSGIYGTEMPQGRSSIPFPVATTAHITDDDNWNEASMDTRYFSKEQVAEYSPRTGDIVVVKSSGSAEKIKSGKLGYVDQQISGTFIFSNFLMRLRPTKVDPKFLYYFLTSYAVKSMLPNLCEASTYPNLRINEYLNIVIPYPEPKEQAAIATTLSDMDAEIEKLESRLTKYRDIKRGMVQTLLTGKVRLLAK